MNFKTFVFMILTFRRVDPIPKNIGLMLSITFWISIVWIISNFAILIMRLINGIDKEKFDHQKVYHKKGAYVIGRRSTNTIEGYWSHLKKMISGTHFWVSRKHLQRYVDCESFRYNTKHLSESERFDVFLQNTKRRLRYSQIN